MVALQTEMVKQSGPFAQFIVPFHFTQSMEAIEGLKVVKNANLGNEIKALQKEWNILKEKEIKQLANEGV